jgi:hypothetical protein
MTRPAALRGKTRKVAWWDPQRCVTGPARLRGKTRKVAWQDPQGCVTGPAALRGKTRKVAWQDPQGCVVGPAAGLAQQLLFQARLHIYSRGCTFNALVLQRRNLVSTMIDDIS